MNHERKTSMGVIFATLFIDLVGFSIAFPLFPAMLHYYLPQAESGQSTFGAIVALLAQWGHSGGMGGISVVVLFGGFMASLYSTLQFLFAPIWGKLSDRYGRRRILMITSLGTALGYLVWGFAGSFWLLVLSRVVTGAMGGNLSVGTAAVADVVAPQERSCSMALVGVAFGMGFIVGPILGSMSSMLNLIDLFPQLERFGMNPFSMAAFAALGLSFINFCWIAWRFHETIPTKALKKARSAHINLMKALAMRLHVKPKGAAPFRKACWVNFFFTAIFSGLEFSLTFLATERLGFTPAQNGWIFLYVGVLMVLTQGIIVRRLIPIIKERPIVLAGLVGSLCAFLAMSAAHTIMGFFAGLVIVSLGAGLMNVLMGLASLYVRADQRGEQLGYFRGIGSLARAIGPLTGAMLYFKFGSTTAYWMGGIAMLLPLIMALGLPQPTLKEIEE